MAHAQNKDVRCEAQEVIARKGDAHIMKEFRSLMEMVNAAKARATEALHEDTTAQADTIRAAKGGGSMGVGVGGVEAVAVRLGREIGVKWRDIEDALGVLQQAAKV